MSPKTKKTKDSVTEKDIHHVVNTLKAAGFTDFIQYLQSPWRIMGINLVAGIFRGLGILIGMTVIFGVLIWVLSQFVNFPLIGSYFQSILKVIEEVAPPEIY